MSTKMMHLLSEDDPRMENNVSALIMPAQSPSAIGYQQQRPEIDTCTVKLLEMKDNDEIVVLSSPHRSYQLIWIAQGSGTYVVEKERYLVQPNTLLLLAPGKIHYLQPTERLSGITIHFKIDILTIDVRYQQSLLPALFRQTSCGRCITLPDREVEQVSYIVNSLEHEFYAQLPGQLAMIHACLWILLTILSRLITISQENERSMPPLVRSFLYLVERHSHTKRLVSDYADMLAVTPGHLNQKVKQCLGKTAGEILREGILLEAKRMLMSTDTSVNEIARHFAFDDPSYFCRFFRRFTGQSPKAFQRAMQQIS